LIRPKFLLILNVHEKLEKDRFRIFQDFAKTDSIDLFGLSRFTEAYNLIPLFCNKNELLITKESGEISKFQSVILEELNFDRQFVRNADFRLVTPPSLPKGIESVALVLSKNILDCFENVRPDYVLLGHPDNWISTSIERLCVSRGIRCGYAVEVLPHSGLFFITTGFSSSNSEIPNLISSELNIKEYPNIDLDLLRIGRKKESLRIKKSIISRLGHSAKELMGREFSAARNLILYCTFFSTRWTYIYRPIFLVTSLYSVQRSLIGFYNSIFYKIYSILDKGFLTKKGGVKIAIFLHAAPEASQLWFGREFTNQLQLLIKVQQISNGRAKVFIKEHPAQYSGLRPIGFYRQLRKHGAQFISKESNLKTITSAIDAIVTINGSVSMEASKLNFPCFLADSRSWYHALSSIYDISELDTFISLAGNNESKPISPKLDIEQYYALMLGNGILVKAESDSLAQWKAAMKSLD